MRGDRAAPSGQSSPNRSPRTPQQLETETSAVDFRPAPRESLGWALGSVFPSFRRTARPPREEQFPWQILRKEIAEPPLDPDRHSRALDR